MEDISELKLLDELEEERWTATISKIVLATMSRKMGMPAVVQDDALTSRDLDWLKSVMARPFFSVLRLPEDGRGWTVCKVADGKTTSLPVPEGSQSYMALAREAQQLPNISYIDGLIEGLSDTDSPDAFFQKLEEAALPISTIVDIPMDVAELLAQELGLDGFRFMPLSMLAALNQCISKLEELLSTEDQEESTDETKAHEGTEERDDEENFYKTMVCRQVRNILRTPQTELPLEEPIDLKLDLGPYLNATIRWVPHFIPSGFFPDDNATIMYECAGTAYDRLPEDEQGHKIFPLQKVTSVLFEGNLNKKALDSWFETFENYSKCRLSCFINWEDDSGTKHRKEWNDEKLLSYSPETRTEKSGKTVRRISLTSRPLLFEVAEFAHKLQNIPVEMLKGPGQGSTAFEVKRYIAIRIRVAAREPKKEVSINLEDICAYCGISGHKEVARLREMLEGGKNRKGEPKQGYLDYLVKDCIVASKRNKTGKTKVLKDYQVVKKGCRVNRYLLTCSTGMLPPQKAITKRLKKATAKRDIPTAKRDIPTAKRDI